MNINLVKMFIICMMVVGCASPAQNAFNTETPFIPTASRTNSTLEPSIQFTNTLPPSPPATRWLPTSTPLPTITTAPTLPAEEKVAAVNELDKTNGDCAWPCWWGIVPGISKWDVVSSYLRSIAAGIGSYKKFPYNLYVVGFPMQDGSEITVDFYVNQGSKVIDVIYTGQDNSIGDLFAQYGPPSEIWFFSDGDVPDGAPFMKIALYYPGKGIMASYWGNGRPIMHNGVKYMAICANEFNEFGPVFLFTPDTNRDFDSLPLRHINDYPTNYGFERLDAYTNLSENDFYTGVLSKPKTTCLETPAKIWPEPSLFITPTP